MIISHKYKFIFIKTSKTAGTSTEIALSRFCGPEDVITEISPEDEKIREVLGHPGPQNYLVQPEDRGNNFLKSLFKLGDKTTVFRNHTSAKRIQTIIGKEVWDSYFKFCIDRNPWDKVVSLYFWTYRSESRPPFQDFIESDLPLRLKNGGINLYSVNGSIAVDRICKYENLMEDLDQVVKTVGIPEKLELPNAKSRFRKGRKDYRKFYNDTTRTKIADLFLTEIKLLGYQF